MKIRGALLLCTALLMPVTADADPVSAFFAGIASGFTTGVGVASGIGGAFAVGSSLGVFFTTTLGSLLLNAAVNFGLSALLAPDAPTIEAARVNSRTVDGPRWVLCGPVAVGGHVGTFGEYDEDGNFWYIVVHGQGEMLGSPTYFLDNIQVTLSDGSDGFTAGDVLTDDFCLTTGYSQFEGDGTRVPYYRMYTVSPTTSQAWGTKPSALTTAFPGLAADFLLAGLTYTVVRCKAVPTQHYGKIYRWRGAFALGEPQVSVYADFTRVYDPSDVGQDIDDATTWGSSGGNPALIYAWFRTAAYGRNQPMAEINWDNVETQAAICDESLTDRAGDPVPRYRGGFAFPDSKPRFECESEILATCDGFTVYDGEGRAWPRVGKYEAPSLTFTDSRDIMSMELQVIDDGESALDGVIVEYISPNHGYTKQQSAPWRNTAFYDGTTEPNYLVVPILGCQNHNQAVRLARAIGLRAGPDRRGAFGVGPKGILAKGERAVTMDCAPDFQGVFEIVSPVKVGAGGKATALVVVPLQTDRWELGAGEEGAPPAVSPSLNIDDSLVVAANVAISAVSVAISGGQSVRMEATFDSPARIDRSYRFRYRTGTDPYEYFATDMDENLAYSALVADGVTYRVSWQTITSGGRATVWSDERDTPVFVDVVATANPTAPAALTAFEAADGVGESVITVTSANDANQARLRIYRGTTTDFSAASLITTLVFAGNTSGTYTDGSLGADTYQYWAEPLNASNVAGTRSGPNAAIIT